MYDEQTRTLEKTLNARDEKITGHQNRIYGVKCHPEDPNLFFSGGWDHTLKIYNIKEGLPIASIGAPELSGDAIDALGDMILTGSYRNNHVMQLFSASQKKLIYTFEFN